MKMIGHIFWTTVPVPELVYLADASFLWRGYIIYGTYLPLFKSIACYVSDILIGLL